MLFSNKYSQIHDIAVKWILPGRFAASSSFAMATASG